MGYLDYRRSTLFYIISQDVHFIPYLLNCWSNFPLTTLTKGLCFGFQILKDFFTLISTRIQEIYALILSLAINHLWRSEIELMLLLSYFQTPTLIVHSQIRRWNCISKKISPCIVSRRLNFLEGYQFDHEIVMNNQWEWYEWIINGSYAQWSRLLRRLKLRE